MEESYGNLLFLIFLVCFFQEIHNYVQLNQTCISNTLKKVFFEVNNIFIMSEKETLEIPHIKILF